MELELVSAVMVTGKQTNAARRELALNAIQSFCEQTYARKELLIVNDGQSLSLPSLPNVVEIMVPTKLSLGELRNIGLSAAKGRWIIQWDDDDYSHQRRIEYQLENVKWPRASLLQCQVRYSFANDSAFVKVWPKSHPTKGIPGTVLHPNLSYLKYTPLAKGEDDDFLLRHFRDLTTVVANEDFPEAYVRFYHGQNTWHASHIMGRHSEPAFRHRWDLPKDASEFLKKILLDYPRVVDLAR